MGKDTGVLPWVPFLIKAVVAVAVVPHPTWLPTFSPGKNHLAVIQDESFFSPVAKLL